MNSSLLYRIASVLLVLFAVGHTIGFRQPAKEGSGKAVGELMQSVHIDVQGFQRSFWDFFVGFGFFITAFLLLAAFLCWQLGGLSPDVLRQMPFAATWGLAVCFVVVTILSWTYFFTAPGVLSTLATLCLLGAAWLAGKT